MVIVNKKIKYKLYIMILNDNIRFIIYTYYTYTDKMLIEFRDDWKEKIKKTNRLFNTSQLNIQDQCYICENKDHINWECPKYYCHIHIINTLII